MGKNGTFPDVIQLIQTNPYNRLLSPGGSSGGESALLALQGSFIGIGTDIGGSIRIPGAFTNLYSLRPTFGRFPTYGATTALAGQEAVNSVNGTAYNKTLTDNRATGSFSERY
jgi:Asp-tRNA(Asn)/Glu-tRNA(Gln) amidotransferase A subunit family amidase